MSINRLKINHFRNLAEIDLELSPSFNLFFGQNGAGKTSLLEAVYYLSRNRSFRSNYNKRIIQFDEKRLVLYSQINNDSIGIERALSGESLIKINGDTVQSNALLASYFPLILIHADTFHILDSGPDYRRQFMDWGMFHVEHDYLILWKRYQKLLKQRNTAIRQRLSKKEIIIWDEELINTAIALDKKRKEYFKSFKPSLLDIASRFLPGSTFNISYYPGWNEEKSLPDLIKNELERDLDLGYTYNGPHRADIKININGIPAKDVLSRGQQKLFITAMCLAIGKLFREQAGITPIYLIDDLAAELDQKNQQILINELASSQSQVFLTLIEPGLFEEKLINKRMFHVEHGLINVFNTISEKIK